MRRPRWTVPRLLAAILTIATLLGMVCAVVVDRTVQAQQLDTVTDQVDDHEARLRLVQQRLDQIAVDVRWIRAGLEQQWKDRK